MKAVYFYLCSFLAIHLSLFSEKAALVNSSPMTQKEEAFLQEQLQKDNPNAEKTDPNNTREMENATNLPEELSNGYFHNIAQINKPINRHYVLNPIPSDKEFFEIENGAGWKINSWYKSTLSSWKQYDEIYIFRNTNWFWSSGYRYRIYNKSNDSVIYANLYTGPYDDKKTAYKINDLDPVSGYIELINFKNDILNFRVATKDLYLFQFWKTNHTIIIGNNEAGWFSPIRYILINSEKN